MTVHAVTATRSLDWSRVTAMSTAVAAHVVAVALVAMPLALPSPRILPAAVEVALREVVPPPVVPTPPEPVAPPHVPRLHTPVATTPKASPVNAVTTDITSPMPVSAATTSIANAPTDIAPASAPAAAGETRTLAYNGALRLVYPPAAARAHEQGTVLLRVLVDVRGAAQRIEIARSSGHTQLDAAAREAVRHARFRPVLQGGQPVPAWGLVPIEFRLDRA
ncbi:energy transducer TonB [Dokdonella soli]|uniref:Energy transducer TonB n=1 Tax=Dokdonella soli TaxID=529810 RepID=A0ABN1IPK4_9GAMM